MVERCGDLVAGFWCSLLPSGWLSNVPLDEIYWKFMSFLFFPHHSFRMMIYQYHSRQVLSHRSTSTEVYISTRDGEWGAWIIYVECHWQKPKVFFLLILLSVQIFRPNGVRLTLIPALFHWGRTSTGQMFGSQDAVGRLMKVERIAFFNRLAICCWLVVWNIFYFPIYWE